MEKQILIAHCQHIVREGLKALIGSCPGLKVVGDTGDGRQTVELVRRHKPDVVVMDLVLPDQGGVETIRQIRQASEPTRIVIFTSDADRMSVTAALKAGASGFLWKDCAFDELAHALKAVTGGRVYLSPGIADLVVDEYVNHGSENGNGSNGHARLTDRQREVLRLMAEGRTTKQIAVDLSISPKTVDTHRQDLMTKLNLFSVAQLTKYAIREGLTTLDP